MKAKTKSPRVSAVGLRGFIEENGQQHPAAADLLLLIKNGWELKRQAEEVEARLKVVNAAIQRHFQPGQAIEVAGVCRVTVSARQKAVIKEVGLLCLYLGARFRDLVIEQTTHQPTKKLLEMAEEDEKLRASLEITTSTVVTYRPVAAQTEPT